MGWSMLTFVRSDRVWPVDFDPSSGPRYIVANASHHTGDPGKPKHQSPHHPINAPISVPIFIRQPA